MPSARALLLLACSLGFVAGNPAWALLTPQQACVIARDRAAGAKLAASMSCYAKAKRGAVAVDPACLAKAEAKFAAAATKAGPACSGTAAKVDAVVEASIGRLLAAVPGNGLCPYKSAGAAGKMANSIIRCQERFIRGPTGSNSARNGFKESQCETKGRIKLDASFQKVGACGDAPRVEAEVAGVADTLLTLSTSVVAPGDCGTFVKSWYAEFPRGIAVDVNGDVLVRGIGEVQRFLNDGTFVSAFAASGLADIAIDASSNIYVLDGVHVDKFAPDGTFLTAWGSLGSGDGQFAQNPRGIAVAGGNVYVADTFNYRVQKFTDDGTFLTAWGSFGTGDGQFDPPYGIAADSAGGVWVADGNGDITLDTRVPRIQHFQTDGTFLARWSQPFALHIALGGNNLFLTDVDFPVNPFYGTSGAERVQKLLGDGTPLAAWASGGPPVNVVNLPGALAVDAAGSVYVVLPDRNLIRKFRCS